MRMVVVFPEPLGPRNPNTDPRGTAKSMLFTATWWPKRLVSPRGLDSEPGAAVSGRHLAAAAA